MAKLALGSLTKAVVDTTEEAPIRVLHVDDEPSFLKVAKRCLEMEGAFQVETALSVEEAAEKIKKKRFDVIISDYVMPGKDGLEFLKELREKGDNTPFIMLTGKGREEVAMKALNFGADQYLNKAGDPETVYGELAHGIRQALKTRQMEEAQREIDWGFRSLVELAPDSIATLDTKGMITSCNNALREKIGYSKGEIVGKHWSKLGFFRARDLPKYAKMFSSFIRGKVPEPFEINCVCKDGTLLPLEVRISLLKKGGKILGLLAISRDITERKQTEEKMILQSSFLKMLTDGIVVSDANANIREVNDAILRMYGTDNKEDLIGKNSFDFIAPEDREKAFASLKEVLEKGYKKGIEYHIITKDGSKINVEMNSSAMKDKDGELLGFVAIVRDITERKQMEEALRESEEKYRKLFEEALDAIFIADAETGIIIDCNRAASELVGREKSELVGKHQRILHPPQEIEGRFSRTFKQHLKEKEGQVLETQVITKKGEIKDIAIKANVFELWDKKLIQGTFRDITERKKAEEALAQERDLLRALMDNIPDTIYFKDVNSRFLRNNKAHARVLGLKDPKEVVGKTDFDFFSPEHAQAAYADEQRIVKTGKPVINKEEKARRADGQFRWVSTTKVPIIDEEGHVTGIVGISRNITERKEAEEKLNETLKNLKLLNEKLRVVGKLTRHDVRNKLSAVAGNVFLAKRRLTGDHEALEYLKDVESACLQVEEIFDFARTYEMLGVEKLVYMDVEKSLDEAISLFSDLHGVKLVDDCRGLTVLADSLLRQLFYNLIDNSLKHGEKVNRIRVHYEETGKDQLKLVYEDDGVGIPQAEKKKIFEEGYGKGTGYGLYLIQRLCEVYGWTIRETGKEGKGAQFTITIPKMDESGKEGYRLTSPVVKAKVENRHSLSRLTVPPVRH